MLTLSTPQPGTRSCLASSGGYSYQVTELGTRISFTRLRHRPFKQSFVTSLACIQLLNEMR